MAVKFSKIGLMGKSTCLEIEPTFNHLLTLFKENNITPVIEKTCSYIVADKSIEIRPKEEIAKHTELIIVVGGDGSLLNAARAVVDYQIPVIGINRGRKGFLTDVSPQALNEELMPILQGDFIEEHRFLLYAQLYRNNKEIAQNTALNDVVVYSGDVARMIEVKVNVNSKFVHKHHCDGLITATPTGSTAYALSGGGPILHPKLNAIVLVPMHPHTLTSRPIVIDNESIIEITLTDSDNDSVHPRISCDGQVHFNFQKDDTLKIGRYKTKLKLLHHKNYDYYDTLRSKLNWTN